MIMVMVMVRCSTLAMEVTTLGSGLLKVKSRVTTGSKIDSGRPET